MTNDEADILLDHIQHQIPKKTKVLILIIDGEDVTEDTYHQSDNLTYDEVLKVLHVLKGRAIETHYKELYKNDSKTRSNQALD